VSAVCNDVIMVVCNVCKAMFCLVFGAYSFIIIFFFIKVAGKHISYIYTHQIMCTH